MTNSASAYSKGYGAGSYSKNPYDEDSNEFDEFERGRTQSIKRASSNDSFSSGWDSDDDYEDSTFESREVAYIKSEFNRYKDAKKK